MSSPIRSIQIVLLGEGGHRCQYLRWKIPSAIGLDGLDHESGRQGMHWMPLAEVFEGFELRRK